MMQYLLPTILCLIVSISTTFGNPIFLESTINKTWERCLVSVSKDVATVSCAVGYGFSEGVSPPSNLEVLIPVVWLQGANEDTKRFSRSCDPCIEIGDAIFRPDKVTFSKDPSLPADLSIAICHFTVRVLIPKSFSMVASYSQPIYNGLLYYMPLFEHGRSPEMSDKFTISLFPTKGVGLELSSEHASKATAMSTRITIHPRHNELIVVKTKPGEQDGSGNGG
jgi:hypothetical protein